MALTLIPDIVHYPVMRTQVLEALNPKECAISLDCTVGLGGHATCMLEAMPLKGLLIGLDKDAQSLEIASKRLSRFGDRCFLEKSDFIELDKVLNHCEIDKVDAVLFDLGISTYHLDTAQRGFSFLRQGPLDMRIDTETGITAYEIINTLGEGQLADIIWQYGEERFSRRIAKVITAVRTKKRIETTKELAEIIRQAVPVSYRYGRIHPATRTFLGLRIAVNHELERIEPAIEKAVSRLRNNGRLAIISFHSLEDRIVKNTFKKLAALGVIDIVTKKPLTPSQEETAENKPSRSAKLRVARKI